MDIKRRLPFSRTVFKANFYMGGYGAPCIQKTFQSFCLFFKFLQCYCNVFTHYFILGLSIHLGFLRLRWVKFFKSGYIFVGWNDREGTGRVDSNHACIHTYPTYIPRMHTDILPGPSIRIFPGFVPS